MTDDEITAIVKRVLEEEKQIHAQAFDNIALRTVASILTAFGMNDDDRSEIREDFAYLRRWRKTAEQVQRGWWIAFMAVLVSGIASAFYLGVRAMLGKGG
jgi:hypothetical protein